ncbi:MAG: 50S ribosomal protein L28 [bacterium]|nr:50S ribosomal protein L28 [bacterium]
MARICDICKKGKTMGNMKKLLRGHYNITGRRSFKPNLQSIKHEGNRVLACVRCIRTKSKNAAV